MLASQPGTVANDTDILARESAADNVSGNAICAQTFSGELSNIDIAWDCWPMVPQYGAAVRLDFAEGDGSESAGSLESETKSADPAKQIEYTQHSASLNGARNQSARFVNAGCGRVRDRGASSLRAPIGRRFRFRLV